MLQEKTIVKRLGKAARAEPADCLQTAGDVQFFTQIVHSRNEAVESKLKLLRGSFFGRPMVKFEVKSMSDVWVPYCYLEYDFSVERKIMFKQKGLMKTGTVGLVFDLNEMHPFQYDLFESAAAEKRQAESRTAENAQEQPLPLRSESKGGRLPPISSHEKVLRHGGAAVPKEGTAFFPPRSGDRSAVQRKKHQFQVCVPG